MIWKKKKGAPVYMYSKFIIAKNGGLWDIYFDGKHIGSYSKLETAKEAVFIYG